MNIEQIRDTYLGTPQEKNGVVRDQILRDDRGKTFGEYFSDIKSASIDTTRS